MGKIRICSASPRVIGLTDKLIDKFSETSRLINKNIEASGNVTKAFSEQQERMFELIPRLVYAMKDDLSIVKAKHWWQFWK